MSELPFGWEWTTIGEIAEVQLGRQRSPKNHNGPHMRPYLRSANVTWSGIDISDVKEMNFEPEEAATFELQPRDLLLNEASGSPNEVGKPAIWRGEIEGCCFQNTLLRVRPREVSPEYLYWYCRAAALSGGFGAAGRGVNIRHLGKQGLSAFPLALPPLPEQERIVAAIEEHFSRLDSAERALQSAEMRLSQFAAAPSSARSDWPRVPLGHVAEVFVGTTPKRSAAHLWGGPVAWVSSGEVAFCRITRTRETISEEAVRPDRIHPRGTVLMAMIGEGKTRGQVAILDIPAAHNQNSAAIRPNPDVVTAEWLYQALKNQYLANRRVGSGNNQPALNKARVAALTIPLPPLSEQRRLGAEQEQIDVCAGRLHGDLAKVRSRTDSLRHTILAAAFSGQLVPQDQSDKPATALLERIRAEREAATPTKRTRKAKAL
jgi:type I restriction enzyme S subunit